jgi:hypothetical protein
VQANTGVGDRDSAAAEADGWLENGDDSSWDRGDGREISARNRGRGSNQGGGLSQAVMLAHHKFGVPANNPQSVRRVIHNPEPICPGAAGQVTCSRRWWGALLGAWTSGRQGVRNWKEGRYCFL